MCVCAYTPTHLQMRACVGVHGNACFCVFTVSVGVGACACGWVWDVYMLGPLAYIYMSLAAFIKGWLNQRMDRHLVALRVPKEPLGTTDYRSHLECMCYTSSMKWAGRHHTHLLTR